MSCAFCIAVFVLCCFCELCACCFYLYFVCLYQLFMCVCDCAYLLSSSPINTVNVAEQAQVSISPHSLTTLFKLVPESTQKTSSSLNSLGVTKSHLCSAQTVSGEEFDCIIYHSRAIYFNVSPDVYFCVCIYIYKYIFNLTLTEVDTKKHLYWMGGMGDEICSLLTFISFIWNKLTWGGRSGWENISTCGFEGAGCFSLLGETPHRCLMRETETLRPVLKMFYRRESERPHLAASLLFPLLCFP